MNFKKSLLLLALPAMMFVSCKQNDSAAPAAKDNKLVAIAAKPQTASFTIDGMSCAIGCAKTIENKLAHMDGVTKATVDFDKKLGTVEFDANKQTPEKLVQAVEATGDGKTYKVSNVKASGDHAMLLDNNSFKEKEKKAKAKKADDKKGCSEGKTGDTKPACCSGKKTCHM